MKAVFAILLVFVAGVAFSQPPVTITHETQWYFQGVPCGTQKTCKALATTAAQANPGVIQQVFPAPYDLSVPASGGTGAPPPCPNIGAYQPLDYTDANGNPVFADPCHGNQS